MAMVTTDETKSGEAKWQEKLRSIPQRSGKFATALKAAMKKHDEAFINKMAQSVKGEKGVRHLGQSCVKDMPYEVEEILSKHNVDDSEFFCPGKEWGTWGSRPASWPSETPGWNSWVLRVESEFGNVWKQLGIHDCIMLSTMKIPCDRPMLAAALCFWSSTTNSLELRFGAVSPTIIDMAAIIGLPPHGQVVDNVFSEEEFEVDLTEEARSRGKGRAATGNFGTWTNLFNKGKEQGKEKSKVTRIEHAAFLACWLCKFVVCTPCKKVTVEYYRLAEALASDKVQAREKPLALGPFVLAHLYRCLHQIVTRGMNPNCGGLLWIFQLWLHTYFPQFRQPNVEFAADAAIGLHIAPLDLRPHTAEECFEMLFDCPAFSTEMFAVCFSRKYPSYLAADISQFISEEETNGKIIHLVWKSALSMRDLFWGTMSNRMLKCGVELYFPSYFSRQLGYYQVVPAPVPESSNRYSSLRAMFRDKEAITQNNKAYDHNLGIIMRPRVATSRCSAEYNDWWARHVAERFKPGVEKAKASVFDGNLWSRTRIGRTKGKKKTTAPKEELPLNSDQVSLKKCVKSINPRKRKATASLDKNVAKDASTISSASHSPPTKHVQGDDNQTSESEEDMVLPGRNRPTNSKSAENTVNIISNEEEGSSKNKAGETEAIMNSDESSMDDEPQSPESLEENLSDLANKTNQDVAIASSSEYTKFAQKVIDSTPNVSQVMISSSMAAHPLSEKSVSADCVNECRPVYEQGFEATFQAIMLGLTSKAPSAIGPSTVDVGSSEALTAITDVLALNLNMFFGR